MPVKTLLESLAKQTPRLVFGRPEFRPGTRPTLSVEMLIAPKPTPAGALTAETSAALANAHFETPAALAARAGKAVSALNETNYGVHAESDISGTRVVLTFNAIATGQSHLLEAAKTFIEQHSARQSTA